MMKSGHEKGVNFLPGILVLALSIVVVAIGFANGAKVMPFGGIAIAACLFSALLMIKRRSSAPGLASFFIAVPVIAAATFMATEANASVVAAVAGSHAVAEAQKPDNAPSLAVAAGSGNDGFVVAPVYYREGPELKVCHTAAPQDELLMVKGTTCYKKVMDRSGLMNEVKTVRTGAGLDLQSYLDREFGAGKTSLTGVAPRREASGESLVIFYKINR